MKTLRLILGDQLNPNHSWFKTPDENITYLMMEIRPETDYIMHHLQKLLGVLAGMRDLAKILKNRDHKVIYLKLTDENNLQDFGRSIREIIKNQYFDKFEYQEPDEYRVDQVLKEVCETLPVPSGMVSSEHFLTERFEVRDFFGGKHFLMESFYRMIRKRLNILMENGKPAGGQWNYDIENRRKYDGKIQIPPPLEFTNDCSEVFSDLVASGVKFFGSADPAQFAYPINREQALKVLQYFNLHLLPYFGTYQDAMTEKSWSLFHSRISFALNTKMIQPGEVVESALEEWIKRKDEIGIEQVEGFVRQIIGWREYVRGVYWAKMPEYATMNFFQHNNKLPDFYWTGNTRMNCMKHAIGQSLQKAYAHHIQRLMITGNFALLAQIHPDEVDEWYLGVYIDAFEWVEITNTRGMSQYADGGIMASKPYVSSANYINNMSDYCRNCFYDAKKRTGDKACPFNSLFWYFYLQHEEKLRKNPRIGMVYRNIDRMSPQEKSEVIEQAGKYLSDLEKL